MKKNMFILHTEEKFSQKRNVFQPIKRLSSYPPTLTIVIFFLLQIAKYHEQSLHYYFQTIGTEIITTHFSAFLANYF